MQYQYLKYEVKDKIATITLNRPEKMNALNADMYPEIIEALDQADQDDKIRVVVFTGEGKCFCAGQDLGSNDKFGRQKNTVEEYRDKGGLISLRIYDLKKPCIAAINGSAIGIGITMTLPMDIRIASNGAKIGFPFVRLGIINEACSSYFLPRIVGVTKALEWLMSGRTFMAQEGLEGGLFTKVVEPENVLPTAYEFAREIADNSAPVSVALARAMVWQMQSASHPMDGHEIESQAMFWTARQTDSKEGITAFMEKRKPQWKLSMPRDMPSFYPWWKERKFREK